MIYIVVHKDEHTLEYDLASEAKGAMIGNFHIYRFKKTVPALFDAFERYEASDIANLKHSIEATGTVRSKKRIETYNKKNVGEFDSIVSHNFCDSSTWNDGSEFIMGPNSGEIWTFQKGEVQFTGDMAFGTNEFFIDYYVHVHPDLDPMIGKTVHFPTKLSIFDLGNEHYSAPIQTEMPSGITTVVFNYASALQFFGDFNLYEKSHIAFRLKDETQLGGEKATISMVVT